VLHVMRAIFVGGMMSSNGRLGLFSGEITKDK
jgi:hypothetical protein